MAIPYMFRDSSPVYAKAISALFERGALDDAEAMLDDIWRTAGAGELLDEVKAGLPSLSGIATPIVKALARPWKKSWTLVEPFNALVFALEVDLDQPLLRVFGAHEHRGSLTKELEYLNLYLTESSDNAEDPFSLNGLLNTGAFALKYRRTFVAGRDAYHHLKAVQFARALHTVFRVVSRSKAFEKNVAARPFTCWLEPHQCELWPALPIDVLPVLTSGRSTGRAPGSTGGERLGSRSSARPRRSVRARR